MALRAFLVALRCPQHEEIMLGLGFDDVAAFATFDDDDVQAMEDTLLAAGIPIGHVQEKIMHTVRACQDKELQHEGCSPLKFNYYQQMPLLEILRDEVRTLKEQVRESQCKAHERELVMLEEHGKWKESAELDKDTLRAKQVFFIGSNPCPDRPMNAVRNLSGMCRFDSLYAKGRAQGREEASRSRGQEDGGGAAGS